MPQNLYEILWIFLIYAFIGWCVEVTYVGLNKGEFVNRGFLNGPYCPIYGVGVVIVVALLTPIQENLLFLFLGSVLLTTVLEFLTGFLLEKVFHNKWWDYSDCPFNLRGYVCLKFSLLWGLGCTFIIRVVHPLIYSAVQKLPYWVGVWILAVLCIAFVVDCSVTVATILRLNHRIKTMDMLAENIRKLSDELGEDIFEKVSKVVEKSGELQQERNQLRQRLSERKEEYNKLLSEKSRSYKRLVKAFPNMKSRNYNEMLQQYKEQLVRKIHGKKEEENEK